MHVQSPTTHPQSIFCAWTEWLSLSQLLIALSGLDEQQGLQAYRDQSRLASLLHSDTCAGKVLDSLFRKALWRLLSSSMACKHCKEEQPSTDLAAGDHALVVRQEFDNSAAGLSLYQTIVIYLHVVSS